jgi:hypothetical protein
MKNCINSLFRLPPHFQYRTLSFIYCRRSFISKSIYNKGKNKQTHENVIDITEYQKISNVSDKDELKQNLEYEIKIIEK